MKWHHHLCIENRPIHGRDLAVVAEEICKCHEMLVNGYLFLKFPSQESLPSSEEEFLSSPGP